MWSETTHLINKGDASAEFTLTENQTQSDNLPPSANDFSIHAAISAKT